MSGAIHNPALVPPGPATTPPAAPDKGGGTAGGSERAVFGAVLQEHIRTLQFSKHALARVERRSIDLADGTLARLEQGVARAASKGSRESVVFVDGTAFVVSVGNRTVITAVDPEHMREHVFTNIDSAVIA